MGNEDGSQAVGSMEFTQEADDHLAGPMVEASGRLVSEKNLGRPDQRPGQGDTLLLAAGQFAGAVRFTGFETNFI